MKIGKFLLTLLCFISCLTAKEEKAIVVTTITKSGTQLINKCIRLMTGKTENKLDEALRKPQFFYTVNHFSSRVPVNSQKAVNILNVRDPRDIVCSFLNARTIHRGIYEKKWKKMTLDEKLNHFISPNSSSFYLCHQLRGFVRAMENHPEYLIVKYENLVDPEGGGSMEKQMQELRRIADYIQLEINEENLKDVRDQLYGNTWTFKKGQIGGWRDTFNFEQYLLFKKLYQDDLVKLGYEKDENW